MAGVEIREGFLCPICVQDLGSVIQLQDHFELVHAGEDRAVLNQLKGCHFLHVISLSCTRFITGPPNGPVLFCTLSSVVVRRRRLSCSVMLWACGPDDCQACGKAAVQPAARCVDAERVGGPVADTARRTSELTG